MILVAYRHGLRVSELVDLRWDQISFSGAVLHVRRRKNGSPATHGPHRAGITRPEPPAAGAGATVTVRVHHGAEGTVLP